MVPSKNLLFRVPNLLPDHSEASFPGRFRLPKLRVYYVYGRADSADRGASLSILLHDERSFYSAFNALLAVCLTSFHFAGLGPKPDAAPGYFFVTPLAAFSTCATHAKNLQRNFHM